MTLHVDPEVTGTVGRAVVYAEMTEHGFAAQVMVGSDADALALAASFPKSYRVRAVSCSGETYASRLNVPNVEKPWQHPAYESTTTATVSISVQFASTGVTGEANEAGIKRARAFLAKAAKLGYEILWLEPGMAHCAKTVRYGHGDVYTVTDNYMTREQAEQRLGI